MTNLIGMALIVLSVETNVQKSLVGTAYQCDETNCLRQTVVTNYYYRIGTTNGVEFMRLPVPSDVRKRGGK